MAKKIKENEISHEEKRQYYIVDKTILSASIQKVIAVNEMVKNEHISKHEGIRRTGLSRSTYYKYKDFIKPFFEGSQEKYLTFICPCKINKDCWQKFWKLLPMTK
ncbi:hypothetical protein HMPREF9466_02729 [Fusobacterium necrophorum subsp. funduliforme 1_1_36S]|nr:hypothetical protein HMPREF9466_02729 [Fusobacterium necrophorum subsp. funduliforme 1_1_36S]